MTMSSAEARPTAVWGRRVSADPGASLVVSATSDPRDPSLARLEVHYRAGTRAPRVGETLGVWIDASTPYAYAPPIWRC